MPPKVETGEARVVILKTVGGEIGAAASLAPKVGPLGLSPKKVGEDIKAATEKWKGIKVMVKLTIINRVATVEVIPSASALIVKELAEPPRDRKKVKNIKHNGNLTWEQIRKCAKEMRPRSGANEFVGTLKEIVGTAVSIGCTIEKKTPKEIIQMVNNGELDTSEP
jgi:large subunit ribosomal protein L12e